MASRSPSRAPWPPGRRLGRYGLPVVASWSSSRGPAWQAGDMSASAAPSPETAPSAPTVLYRERLLPSRLVWLIPPATGISFWFIISAVHNLTGVVIAITVTIALTVLLWATSPVVQVRADEQRRWWHAGRARIEVEHLGAGEVLDAQAMRQAMGRELSTTAFVCQRPWVPSGVRVQITDAEDPTPYWLVSTRDPHGLLEALGRRPEH